MRHSNHAESTRMKDSSKAIQGFLFPPAQLCAMAGKFPSLLSLTRVMPSTKPNFPKCCWLHYLTKRCLLVTPVLEPRKKKNGSYCPPNSKRHYSNKKNVDMDDILQAPQVHKWSRFYNNHGNEPGHKDQLSRSSRPVTRATRHSPWKPLKKNQNRPSPSSSSACGATNPCWRAARVSCVSCAAERAKKRTKAC